MDAPDVGDDGLGSPFPNATPALFADGRVSTVRYTVNVTVAGELWDWRDRHPLNESDYE
jgi:hypothetical protein